MADFEKTEDQVTKDQVEETLEETNAEETSAAEGVQLRFEKEQQEVDEKKSIMAGLRDKFFPKKEAEIEEEAPEVDSTILEALKDQGFDDEQVAKLSEEYGADQLKKLLPLLVEEEEEEEEESSEEEEEPEKKELPDNIKDELKPYLEEMQKFYEGQFRDSVKELEVLKDRLNDHDTDKVVEEFNNQAVQADKFFDKVAKDFTVFGNTKELPRFPDGHKHAGEVIPLGSAFEARDQVWKMANKFCDLGQGWDDSLNDAFAWYKGKHAEKELKNQLVKDLKRNEQRLSPKRTSKITTRTFESDNDAKLQYLAEARRKAGIS